MTTADHAPSSFGSRIAEAAQTLTPGYFALTVSSGIISVGLELEGFHSLSAALLVVCAVSYTVILVLSLVRLVQFRWDMRRDFMDPGRAFGFFTFIAGTNMLGVRLGMSGWPGATALLLVIAVLAWVVLGYIVPWTAVLGRDERPVVKDANGTWFIWCVASQSVAVAAASVEPLVGPNCRAALALVAVVAWSVGLILYAAVGIFVSLRLMTYPLRPEDLRPQYFVAMGAMAISVLAGARIVEMVVATPKDSGSCNDRAALTDKSPGNRKYTQQEKDEFFAVLDSRFLEWQLPLRKYRTRSYILLLPTTDWRPRSYPQRRRRPLISRATTGTAPGTPAWIQTHHCRSHSGTSDGGWVQFCLLWRLCPYNELSASYGIHVDGAAN